MQEFELVVHEFGRAQMLRLLERSLAIWIEPKTAILVLLHLFLLILQHDYLLLALLGTILLSRPAL